MSRSPQADLDLIAEAAREAGALALDLRRRGLDIEYKAGDSPVTSGTSCAATLPAISAHPANAASAACRFQFNVIACSSSTIRRSTKDRCGNRHSPARLPAQVGPSDIIPASFDGTGSTNSAHSAIVSRGTAAYGPAFAAPVSRAFVPGMIRHRGSQSTSV